MTHSVQLTTAARCFRVNSFVGDISMQEFIRWWEIEKQKDVAYEGHEAISTHSWKVTAPLRYRRLTPELQWQSRGKRRILQGR